jgi:hypothetical protein
MSRKITQQFLGLHQNLMAVISKFSGWFGIPQVIMVIMSLHKMLVTVFQFLTEVGSCQQIAGKLSIVKFYKKILRCS